MVATRRRCCSSVSRSRSCRRFWAIDDSIRARRISGRDRLGQVVRGAHLDAAHDALELIDAGDDDDRQVTERGIGLHGLERLVAVHLGHDDVQQHDVDGADAGVAQEFERLPTVDRLQGLVADRGQEADEQAAIEGRVVDDQHASAGHEAPLGGWRKVAPVDRAERLGQRLGADRLGQVVVHPGRQAHLAVAFHRIGRHRHDPRPGLARPARADPAGRLEPVQLGHLDVHEHDVVDAPLDGGDGLEPVARDVRQVAHPLQQADGELLVHGVVLGEEDPERVAGAEVVIDPDPGRPDLDGGRLAGEDRGERVVQRRWLDRLDEEGGDGVAARGRGRRATRG